MEKKLKCPICERRALYTNATLREHLEMWHRRCDFLELLALSESISKSEEGHCG